ncbi:hypothetical protein NDA13_001136 [Ustilago tritici]|nr:hypothetical protein NDA13_001136 [Ustilago tritici]
MRAFIYVLAGDNIVGLLGSTYNDLFLRFPTFNSTEHAFAVVIVQITQTNLKCHEPPESFGSFRHLAHEFHRPYCGDAPNRFLTFVSRVKKDFQRGFGSKPWYYGTSIVQSSGAGKTRMVYECQKLTPLLYVSFGKMGVEGDARDGYSLADQSVRSYFENAHRDHPHKPDLQVACFLAAWFTTLAQALRPWQTDAEKYQHLYDLNRFEPVSRDDDLPEPLDRYPRNNHFKVISELAASNLPTVFKLVEGKAFKSFRTPSYEKIFDVALRQPLLNLNEQLTAVSRHLRSGQEEAGVPSPLYDTSSFWLVLISTSIQAIYVPIYFELSSSSRGMPSAPMPTFVGVGVNLLAEEQCALSCASQASSVDHLSRYGRPLWPSLEPSHFWDNVLVLLQGCVSFSAHDTAQCFSVMASRLGLGLAPVHEGGGLLFDELKGVTKKSVDEHMRTMSHISKRGTMYDDSPWEPVLAIAASLIMLPIVSKDFLQRLTDWQTAVNTYGSILEYFGKKCIGQPAIAPAITGLKGMHGQLASRIALITAWDAAKRKELDALELQEISQYATVLTRAVPLETILAGLADLDEANADQLRQRFERVQQHGSSTRPALQRPPAGTSAASSTIAWTNFTHFDVLPDHITEISPEYLWCCWKRGLGLQMARSQHGIDGILPVFMGSLEEPFVTRTGTQDDAATSIEMHAARYMTYVAWEAKNRDEPQPEAGSGKPDVMFKLAGPSIMRASHAPPGEEPLTERALICVQLDLGSSTPFVSEPQGFRPRVETINGTECPRLCIRGVTNEHAYPCLDVLKIRAVFQNLSIHILRRRTYELLNEVPNSIWNDHMQPALPLISAAGVSNPPAAATAAPAAATATATATDDNDGAAQCKRQRMDLD